MSWLYENTADNSARFVLQSPGSSPLICIGVNPSTAEPGALDSTLKVVQKVAKANEYDCFLMLNIYPQRSTKPRFMHHTFDPALKAANEAHIARAIADRPLTVWAAWGAVIEIRPYLAPLLRDILELSELKNVRWVSRGQVSMAGHPHHPLYVPDDVPLVPCSVDHYR